MEHDVYMDQVLRKFLIQLVRLLENIMELTLLRTTLMPISPNLANLKSGLSHEKNSSKLTDLLIRSLDVSEDLSMYSHQIKELLRTKFDQELTQRSSLFVQMLTCSEPLILQMKLKNEELTLKLSCSFTIA
jgi:hypothetical protein